LQAAPGVADVAVVGVPDDRLGERLVAVVVPNAGFEAEAFLAWAGDHITGYRRPSEVVEIEELPRGPNGKVDRGAATDLVLQALARSE
jgi:acyl-CoA synthetase (AMP-forming)/AMP-acid ligase II